MCEAITGIALPTMLAIGSAVATTAGAGVAYMGAQSSAAAASNQAKYNAQVASNNQILADRSAADATARGNVQQQLKATQTAALVGRQRVGLAANGQDPNSGSGLDLQSDTAGAGAFDELTIQSNAHREAAGFTQQGVNYAQQATLDEAAGADALNAGALKGASTIIGGAGQVASQWYTQQYGVRQTSPGGLR